MKILAFDTCLNKMYIALSEESNLLASKIVESTEQNYHSAFLISKIKEILKENSLKPSDIDFVSTNIGPGSFTGIRACTTVARIFAQGLNLKTVGVSSLELLSKLNKSEKKTLVALDARKDMAYVAVFETNKTIIEPKSILVSELSELIASDDFYIITDNALKTKIGGASYFDSSEDLGAFLVEIAYEKIINGLDTDWRKLLPLYIQPPPVCNKK